MCWDFWTYSILEDRTLIQFTWNTDSIQSLPSLLPYLDGIIHGANFCRKNSWEYGFLYKNITLIVCVCVRGAFSLFIYQHHNLKRPFIQFWNMYNDKYMSEEVDKEGKRQTDKPNLDHNSHKLI